MQIIIKVHCISLIGLINEEEKTPISVLFFSTCIPNTRPPSEEMKARVFLVLGLSLVNFIPAVLLIVLNILIVVRLLLMSRPGQNTLNKDSKTIKHRDHKTEVSLEHHSKKCVSVCGQNVSLVFRPEA